MSSAVKTLRDSAAMRWIALLLLAMAMFCSYIFMDILSPIKDLMQETRGWDSTAFGTMQGSEVFLNVFVFFLIFAGIILDKMGVRFTAVLSAGVMLAGAIIKWFAVSDLFAGSSLETWFTNNLNYIPGFDELGVSPFYRGMPASAKFAACGFMIFGCGCEMAGITVSRGIVKWFKGREMAMAMGSEMALARLGVATVMIFSPFFANLGGKVDVSRSVAFGVVLMCIALMMTIVYFFMDKKLDSQTGEAEEKDDPFRISDIKTILTDGGFWIVALLCVLYYSAIFPFQKYAVNMLQCNLTLEEPVIMSGSITIEDYDPADTVAVNTPLIIANGDTTLVVQMSEIPHLTAGNNTIKYELNAGNKIKLISGEEVVDKKLPGDVPEAGEIVPFQYGDQSFSDTVEDNFWARRSTTFFQYAIMLLVAIAGFVSNFQKKKGLRYLFLGISIVALIVYCYFGYMRQTAETIFAVFPLLAVLITPILGGFLDHKGKGASMLVLGAILLIACHLTFAFVLPAFKGNAVGGVIVAYATILVLGASFSLVPAALWPSVPKLVNAKVIGSAYALIFWIQNIGLWLFPLLIGKVLDKTNPDVTDPTQFNYTAPLVMLACLGVAALVLGLVLKVVDKKKKLGLEMPNIQE